MIDHQPSKIVTKTFYTGSDKQHYQDMGITSTLWHNVTQSRSVTQTNVTSHHVIHSNNHHHHQSDKRGLSFLDSDFKNVLFELSNPDKSMIIFPKRVIEFHLFFIFDSNISPLSLIQFFTISEVSLYGMTILCKICQLVLLMCFCWMKTFILLSHLQKNLYYFNNLFLGRASAF